MHKKCGPASSLASQSTYDYAFLALLSVLTLIRYASLATDTEYVRERLVEYTNDLISLGIDGLRLDAAKRMSSLYCLCFISDISCSFRRHRTGRHRQYLGKVEGQTVHHSRGE